MSINRLSFLYPHLFKTIQTCEPVVTKSIRPRRKQSQIRSISTSNSHRQETYAAQRYGPAALPPPSVEGLKAAAKEPIKELTASSPKQDDKKPDEAPRKEPPKSSQEATSNPTSPKPASEAKPSLAIELDASESHPQESPDTTAQQNISKPLETVLQMDPPKPTIDADGHRLPNLHAPPYVHHFDTFTLVRDLEKGGFTEPQSVTIMKAVRSLLAMNMDVAKEGLVSKSDVENETYLFRAACSELRTEILNTRKAASQTTRTQLSHLQHELDILSQKATQDALALKDDLRGLLDERKMAARMAQQGRESEIMELNYKISVGLNSDSKSQVEGLRWVLTRRAAMAIASMAVLILGSLRYSTYRIHVLDQERRLAAPPPTTTTASSSTGSGGGGGGGNFTVPSREMATQTTDTEAVLTNLG
ncbi:hypothetical protein MMC12_003415 [Toensbergia leucococca]|nr:hypothetical protein [Toensbergia leucococca]